MRWGKITRSGHLDACSATAINRLLPNSTSRHRAIRRFSDEAGHVMGGNTVLGEGGRAAQRAGSDAKLHKAVVSTGLGAAGDAVDPRDDRAKQVREWLFLLLRFAITRDPEDEVAVLMMANGMDSLGRQWGRAAPSFFRRSSDELCKAIAALDDPNREAILKRHIRRIEHPLLRRAFQTVVCSDQSAPKVPGRSDQSDLWAGLRR
jgi:hypothetical protein